MFAEPVIIETWDATKQKYAFYTRCDIDAPSNPQSLSAFLIEKLNLADVFISGDRFSFRDLFKYSYLKQTEIDNEDIMREKDWPHNLKRKATFEIIFNLFDATLDGYKDTLKKKETERNELIIRLQGIKDFLINSDLTDRAEYSRQVKNLASEIEFLRSQLVETKKNKGVDTSFSNGLRQRIITTKETLKQLASEKNDQQDYLNKLHLSSNQYESEIEKRQMAKDGYFAFSQYEFVYCPNCLKPIQTSLGIHDVCCLCGSEKSESSSELLILEKEIKRKFTELSKFIETEDKKLDGIINSERKAQKELAELEQELQHLYADYDNPQLEQIELLNYEIGQKSRLQYELEQRCKMIEELEGIEKYLQDKNTSIERLRDTIRELAKLITDKQELIRSLSTCFTNILMAFEYPKLSNSYIDEKTFLPYVRGNKYNDIGSLAGVSLITMAYYVAILLEGMADKYHHLNILLIDSPRKNLGAKIISEADAEFKDEKIYNAIIKYFIDIGTEYKDNIQLIIVNNGYPNFLPAENIIAEFDTERDDLPNGLIDDAV